MSIDARFWKEHPALLYSLAIATGIGVVLFPISWIWPSALGLYFAWRKKIGLIALLVAAMGYGYFHLVPEGWEGEVEGVFSCSCLKPHDSPFQKGLKYKGILSNELGSIPVSIYMHSKLENRVSADCDYFVKGVLEKVGSFDFVLKAEEWKRCERSWSLAEMRYRVKEWFRKHLFQRLASKKSALFLSSLATGDVEDRMLRYEFSRLGLQHLLAISGFHFGILLAFCSFALRLFLSRTWRIAILFGAVSVYFVFVGSSPAVERSYLTALFYLVGEFLGRPTSGANLLGIAIGVEVVGNPFVLADVGFQLSFLSCFGILLFTPFFERLLHPILPKRTFLEIQALDLSSKHGYLVSSFLRKSLSLTCAVNLLLFPLILFHFHQFPLLGFLYNLFFPSCVGAVLFLLLLALSLDLLFPPLAEGVYWMVRVFTDFLLELTSAPPLPLDFSIQAAFVPVDGILAYLVAAGVIAVFISRPKLYQLS